MSRARSSNLTKPSRDQPPDPAAPAASGDYCEQKAPRAERMPRLANVLCSRFEAAPSEVLSLCEHEPDAAGAAGSDGGTSTHGSAIVVAANAHETELLWHAIWPRAHPNKHRTTRRASCPRTSCGMRRASSPSLRTNPRRRPCCLRMTRRRRACLLMRTGSRPSGGPSSCRPRSRKMPTIRVCRRCAWSPRGATPSSTRRPRRRRRSLIAVSPSSFC